MTDPSDALASFQAALKARQVQVQRAELDPKMVVHVDQPAGTPRFTYAHLDGRTVTAVVLLVVSDPIEGSPCFQIGYAVPESYRGQGRAKQAVQAALAELWNGFSRNGMTTLYVEAIVGTDNEASQAVAAATLSVDPKDVTDSVSGLPALHYIKTMHI